MSLLHLQVSELHALAPRYIYLFREPKHCSLTALQHKHAIYITGDYNPLCCDSSLSQGTLVEWVGFRVFLDANAAVHGTVRLRPLSEWWDLKRALNYSAASDSFIHGAPASSQRIPAHYRPLLQRMCCPQKLHIFSSITACSLLIMCGILMFFLKSFLHPSK